MKETVFSYANLTNAAFLEELYQKYKEDPNSLDPSWSYFFSGIDFSKGVSVDAMQGDLSVFRLIEAYRKHGHKKAFWNPLQEAPQQIKELELSSFGLGAQDLEKTFYTFGLLSAQKAPLSQIIERLEKVYARFVGFEFEGVDEEVVSWIFSQIEGKDLINLSKEEKKEILEKVTKAELFESFIHTKYPGQTRFSLEGGETLIPMLSRLIELGPSLGVEEILIGMAHRGRLNVLVNVLGKSYEEVFKEFEDLADFEGSGDVKYHKGAHTNIETKNKGFIEISLAPNPSHLESVDPVVEGQTRAKQELKKDVKKEKVMPLLIHGDASLAGQGVVYEILQMGRLEGYTTGGTLHIVVNNQIGYTTLPVDSRSTLYCTGIAKSFGAPVFHVNAERPEECIAVCSLALQIRQRFHIDVFIDLGCYRKYGHNEGDEPTFTQPLEYKKIRAKQSIRELFKETLVKEGVLSSEKIGEEEERFKERLHALQKEVIASFKKGESKLAQTTLEAHIPSLSEKEICFLAEKICKVPDDFKIHPKLKKLLEERLKMVLSKEKTIDWGMAEHLAFATLLKEGVHLRLSGQDVRRGTFSHRHAAFIDQESGKRYLPLNAIDPSQAVFSVYDSLLSEFAVMGFDLGYSLTYPKSLVLWEAQFGDFANGSQVIIDQYLATSEQKWAHRFNFTLLLPHGYEGKGPEHSSARIERFLQLAAENNFIVANCTTPSQFFHLLRRQAYLTFKRPLVVFTPKVLLRYPMCVSSLEELMQDVFKPVIDEIFPIENPEKMIFCSGKVFYDLIQEREKRKETKPTVIIRIEQLYPFPKEEIEQLLKKYRAIKEYLWVQEEHKNMGAFAYMQPRLQEMTKEPLLYVGREESASQAAGSYGLHKKQYEFFMEKAFQ